MVTTFSCFWLYLAFMGVLTAWLTPYLMIFLGMTWKVWTCRDGCLLWKLAPAAAAIPFAADVACVGNGWL